MELLLNKGDSSNCEARRNLDHILGHELEQVGNLKSGGLRQMGVAKI